MVGSCDQGAKKIMYAKTGSIVAPSSSSQPSPREAMPKKNSADSILTECKDGTVSLGGSCKR
jgi:hypothetical protein